jgi:hypothetical protein
MTMPLTVVEIRTVPLLFVELSVMVYATNLGDIFASISNQDISKHGANYKLGDFQCILYINTNLGLQIFKLCFFSTMKKSYKLEASCLVLVFE